MTRRRMVVFRIKERKGEAEDKGNTQENGPPSRVLCRQLSLTDKERVQRTTALHQQSKTRRLPGPNLAIFRAFFFLASSFPVFESSPYPLSYWLPIHALIGTRECGTPLDSPKDSPPSTLTVPVP